MPFQTFQRRCAALGLAARQEVGGGTRCAELREEQWVIEVHHRGTGGGHGGRRPVEIQAVRLREGAVHAHVDGTPPIARGLDRLSPAALRRLEEVLRALSAPLPRGRASAVAKGDTVEITQGPRAGSTGTVEWRGLKRGRTMVSVKTAEGSVFLPAKDVLRADGPVAIVRGLRVRVVQGAHAGRTGDVTWCDPGKTERVEVRMLRDPAWDGPRDPTPSAWLTLADIEPAS